MAKFNSQNEEIMTTPTRERDLVLAPNECAYILDQTKGHIIAYVGPFKTSMANTDQPVYFDEFSKRFVISNMEQSIKAFTIVPEGWYVTLKNPSQDGQQPTTGTSNSLTKLNIGRKVNIPGPAAFALWPGQMVRVVTGHRLRSNQYLLVRVYEEEEAKKNWTKSIIKPQSDDKNVPAKMEIPELSLGKTFIIKGMDVSFYIPPTGIEVVREDENSYVREAVTLERLEYCILLDENGNKRYVKGPAVVFPEPTEYFFEKSGQRKFKAIELSDTSGIYVKVIAPYTEGDKTYNVGQELFITGKEQMIYYPREEHALIKYGDHEIYNAVAIPSGEGRYYLNRLTGQILLKKGPCMFLPDPREYVIVQRILTQNQAALWYPGNNYVLEYNAKLQDIAKKTKEEIVEPQQQKKLTQTNVREKVSLEIAGDEFVRHQSYTAARTITLDTKYLGAATLSIWTGYAVLVISKSGQRKVVIGPQTLLLEYDETLATMELSTGTPKTDGKLIKTCYLKVLYNKVSDIVRVETKDLCPIDVTLSYRVNFEGEPEKWFNVENYVKFLTDHMRSVLRSAMQKLTIVEFYAKATDILRDIILGTPDESGKRNKGRFQENGMYIYDVEILNLQINDAEIEQQLVFAQHEEIRQRLELENLKHNYEFTLKNEEYVRKIDLEIGETELNKIELKKKKRKQIAALSFARVENENLEKQKALEGELTKQTMEQQIAEIKLQQETAANEMQIEYAQKRLNQEIEKIKIETESMVLKANAVTPEFIAALQAFGDKSLAEKMAQSMAPLAILGGKSIAEVLSQLLKGTVIEEVLQKTLPEKKNQK